MEKTHHPHPIGFALALTSGIVYALCALAVWLWPQGTVRMFGTWFHGVDLTRIAVMPTITLGSFVYGLVCIMVFAYLVGALYAVLYNKCYDHCKRKRWI